MWEENIDPITHHHSLAGVRCGAINNNDQFFFLEYSVKHKHTIPNTHLTDDGWFVNRFNPWLKEPTLAPSTCNKMKIRKMKGKNSLIIINMFSKCVCDAWNRGYDQSHCELSVFFLLWLMTMMKRLKWDAIAFQISNCCYRCCGHKRCCVIYQDYYFFMKRRAAMARAHGRCACAKYPATFLGNVINKIGSAK